jgi:long-chain acyl-CoA synthetase
MNIARHVELGRRSWPSRAALIFDDRSYTYRQLDDAASRVASALKSMGVRRGDRVVLLLPNIPAFIVCYLGIQKIGSVAVSLNTLLKPDEIEFMVNDCGAAVAFTTEALLANLPRERLPGLQQVVVAEGTAPDAPALEALVASAPGDVAAAEMRRDEPAAIVYSSGTTGFPKGVVLSHGNVVSNSEAKKQYARIRPDDRILLFVPLYHCFGQNAVTNACFSAGATLVMHRRFELDRVLTSVARNQVTMFFGVPTVFILILNNASLRAVDAGALRSVRYYFSAAASMPAEIAARWRERYGLVINEGYGLTETSPFACYNHEVEYRLGSIGTPIRGVEMAVVDEETGRPRRPGVPGEIVIRGPNVMLGYWNQPEETRRAIRDGWLHTGDIGMTDEDGYFYLVDRLKDMINLAGLKVYPAEVENVLYRHPLVAEAAVYGVPDPVMGERVEAQIVLKPGARAAAEEILALCRRHIADFKVPRTVRFVEALPKSPTGKVLKRVLRAAARLPS